MHLAMILASCFLTFVCVQATPILRLDEIEPRQKYRVSAVPVSSTASPTAPAPMAETPAMATSSNEAATTETSVERSTTRSMLASKVVSAAPTQDPSPVPDPSDLILSPQAVNCDRNRETKTWEVIEAIRALVALGTKKRCYQIAGARPGAFSCTRMMLYGTACVDLCAPLGYSVLCYTLAEWAKNVPNSCSWKPEFFYHWAVTGGMYYPPEGYPRGIYVRIGRNG
ncbi:hypothetical protein BGX38DRAFT_914382 [Terfezia claveryi]|nr:hypothetical protein BGX38DRAFT_914382 [Terfezia claveryi]